MTPLVETGVPSPLVPFSILPPEQAAGALLKALDSDWEELRGKVVDARQVLGRG